MSQSMFILFGALALGAALAAVTRRNAVASAIWLVVMFFGLAGCYVVLEAFFVAAIQVLVYAGAIMVLFLFVIMLLDLRTELLADKKPPLFHFFGIFGALIFAVIAFLALKDAQAHGLFRGEVTELVPIVASDGTPVLDEAGNPKLSERKVALADKPLDGGAEAIAKHLFTRWLLAFEVTSILLLGAILGAVILTKRRLT